MISYRWGGAEWGGTIWNNNVHVPVHTQTGTATSSSFLLSRRHNHCSFMISYRWGGVGWDNNACSCTRTGTALRPPGAWWSSRLEICHANRPIFQNRQVPGTIHSKWVSWVEKKVSAQHGNHFLSSMAAWIGHPQSNEPPVLFENGACHVFPLTVWMKTPLPTH